MPTFSPNSRGHAILRLVADEPMSRQAINRSLGNCDRELRKIGFVIGALRSAGLIRGVQAVRGHMITPEGRDALARLNRNEPVHVVDTAPWSGPAVPTVRFFPRVSA